MLAALGTVWTGAWLLATAPVEWLLATAPGDTFALTAVAAVALLAAVALAARAVQGHAAVRPAVIPVPVRLRATAHRAGPPRLCDPDAAGRPRPRAPSGDRAA